MAEVIAPPADSHMKDFESHLHGLEVDLEYWRVKRLEPRILNFVRRDILPLHLLFRAAVEASLPADRQPSGAPPDGHDREHDHDEHHDEDHEHEPLEKRIRALEDRLDDYVREMTLLMRSFKSIDVVIDDGRTEAGAYDPFFKFTKRVHGGSMEHRLEQLDRELTWNTYVLETFERALTDADLLDLEVLQRRRAEHATFDGARNGARIVARAWVNPEFKRRLIENGREAVREMDIPPGRLAILAVAENTPSVHNVVVCTLCSCYPSELLGNPPWWFRDDSYKHQIVQDPRAKLAESFGFEVPEGKVIEVHDSTSDLRWFVLPERPAGTEGWSEEELARLVTIESLVGVATPVPGSREGS